MPGRKFSFEVHRTSSATPATLFALEADSEQWSRWARPLILQSGWEREAAPVPGGPGAIRRIGLWPVLVRDRIVAYEQDRRHSYTIVSAPLPVRDYLGEVTFTPNPAGGTDLRWTGSFTEALPGTGLLSRSVLRVAVGFLASALVRTAERG